MNRVIYSFATGRERYKTMAKALALSLDLAGSETPRILMTDAPDDPELARLWPRLIPPQPAFPHWFSKLALLDASDADAVMFVDGDSLAVRNPDPLFERLQGLDFAVQGDLHEEESWYGDFGAARRKLGVGAAPTFIGGWMYYERSERTRALFAEALRIAETYDELGPARNMGHVVDEVCLSLAMAKLGIGVVLPPTSDISVTPIYKLSRVRLDVLRGHYDVVEDKYKPLRCKPIFYHSATARYDLRYWVQVSRLFRLQARRRGWPKRPDSIAVKLWRRVAWGATIAFVWLAGLNRRR